MIKKVFLLLISLLCVVVLVACKEIENGNDDPVQLNVPSGFAIEEDYIYFNILSAAKEYVVKFENENETYERVINESGTSVSELMVPAGTYQVSIKAISNDEKHLDSEYSSSVEYVKEERIMELKERELISAGYIKWMGRTYYNEDTKANEVYHSASGFELFFKGSYVSASITATNYGDSARRPYIVIVVDDDFAHATTIALDKATQVIKLVSDNKDIEEHKVDLYKRSESTDSHIAIQNVETDGVFIKKIVNKALKMEFIAASSSTGYGNLGKSSETKTTANSDALNAFAFLTAKSLNADVSIFSASGWGCNASLWTNPNSLNVPDAYDYVDFNSNKVWFTQLYIPDVIVVNLGTNDWSYISNATGSERDKRMSNFKNKYVEFLNKLHQLYPDAQIVVLYGLMNETNVYDITEEIVAVAKQTNPSLARVKLNGDGQGCNSHPSLSSHKDIATKLTVFIKGLLENKQ